MSRVLYLDCFSGISGDMLLGALLDAGLPLEDLKRALGSLALEGVEVSAEKVLRAGVAATKFSVRELSAVSSQRLDKEQGHDHHEHGHNNGHSHEHDPQAATVGSVPSAPIDHHRHPHRSLPEIFAVIDRSSLSESGRERAKALFRQLAEVEASIHQMPVEKVHLHEVGALDSIIDIVGAVFALEWAGVDRVLCSPLNVGGGMVDSAHGRFPVPAPATLKLLNQREAPIYSDALIQKELVTPTGALIATSYADAFGPLPAMSVERVGYGAGDRNPTETPNVLRVMIGRTAGEARADRVSVIECEIDDMNPQIFGVVMDRLYAAGALEVFYIPVQMKKNRPGTLLSVIAPPALRTAVTDVVFRETTTIGVRYTEVDRETLQREFVTVETPIGAVRFKVARRDGTVVNAVPEFDDCVRIAAARQLPVKEVQAIAVEAYGAVRASRSTERPVDGLRGEPRHS
jgi:pyridinium-3,5-bisthiocarboxylic acid mononucleotide nickel chelatase